MSISIRKWNMGTGGRACILGWHTKSSDDVADANEGGDDVGQRQACTGVGEGAVGGRWAGGHESMRGITIGPGEGVRSRRSGVLCGGGVVGMKGAWGAAGLAARAMGAARGRAMGVMFDMRGPPLRQALAAATDDALCGALSSLHGRHDIPHRLSSSTLAAMSPSGRQQQARTDWLVMTARQTAKLWLMCG
jgi:hypothetical protein